METLENFQGTLPHLTNLYWLCTRMSILDILLDYTKVDKVCCHEIVSYIRLG